MGGMISTVWKKVWFKPSKVEWETKEEWDDFWDGWDDNEE
jgi:hypothetical protein